MEVRNLTVEYQPGGPDTTIRSLDRLDLDLEAPGLVALCGPSGSGKTTLLSCLAGILRPSGGTVRVHGQVVNSLTGRELVLYRRTGVGIVFQAFNLLPGLNALENVMAPLLGAGLRRRVAAQRGEGLLEQVGLTERAGQHPGQLSGGQQQRVAIARALAHDPPLLVADEPTAHLDRENVITVMELLARLALDGRLIVVATHDDRVTAVADRLVTLATVASSSGR